MELQLLPQPFAVCQVTNLQQINWQMPFCFLSKTDEELSLVCPEENLPTQTLQCEGSRTQGKGSSAARLILPLLVSSPGFPGYWLPLVSASLLFPPIIPTIS